MAGSGRSSDLDISPLMNLLRRTTYAAQRGANRAMTDIKNDWVRSSRDIAPLDTGNLRKQISGNVIKSGNSPIVEIKANAINSSHFNYAYYIHEGEFAADGKRLRHPGTVEKFLDDSQRQNEERWKAMLEAEILKELQREGW
ncbi:hypothetical protein V7149_00180 [Bacillus sp. JJ1503]|uniref:hypothetical protein n=1 Tax=Bacillus sp. JJ1503 TaxID=3122956 RepID=UPI002FFF2134